MQAARAVPLGLLGGLVSALFVLPADRGGIGALILVAMSSLPVFLVGLGVGRWAACLAIGAGLAATGRFGGPALGFVYVEVVALPALLLVPLALAPPAPPTATRMVLGLTGLGIAAFLAAFLGLQGVEDGLEPLMRGEVLRQLQALQPPPAWPVALEQVADWMAFWIPGLAVASWLLIVAGNAVLAQGVLKRFGWTLRQAPAMGGLRLPLPLGALFVAGLAAALLSQGQVAFVCGNLAEILAVPLVLSGLAVLHRATRRIPARQALLAVVYVLTFVLVWPIALVVATGIIEQWVGLWQRFAARPPRGEQ